MEIDTILSYVQYQNLSRTDATLEVAAVKRGLDQQKLEGEEALKLMAAAAVPIDPYLGQNIDIYA